MGGASRCGRRLSASSIAPAGGGELDGETAQSRPHLIQGEGALLISVVHRSTQVSDAELQAAVRAINRQLEEDFYPHWQFGARLRVDSAGRVPRSRERKVDLPQLPGRRGDAVIYLVDHPTVPQAGGYQSSNNLDVPFGFVFLDVCGEGADCWTVALSHEAIELVGDPLSNLLV